MSIVKLSDPTPREEIKQRQGPGGRQLDYVDARFVMERLDQAVGPFNWQDKFEDRLDGSVRCCIGIRGEDGWVWKCDVGDPSDIESTKGAYSDAFKRAAVKWGIARDLYGDHPARTTKPAEPPRTAPAPRQARPLASVPPPDEPAWEGIETVAQQVFPDAVLITTDDGKCPEHEKAYRSGAKGWYCPTPVEKQGERVTKWCQHKPSKAWAAQQELVTA